MNPDEAVRTVLSAINVVFDITLILATAWGVTSVARMGSGFRHAVWVAAFAALLVIPVVRLVRPAPHAVPIQLPLPVETARVARTTPSPMTDSVGNGFTPALSSASGGSMTTLAQPAVKSRPIPNWPLIARICLMAWATGFVLLLAWMLFALQGLWSLVRSSVPAEWREGEFERLSQRIGLRRPVQLRVSHRQFPVSAMTWGTLRPVVLLPMSAVDWSDEARELILMHEFAHVKRCDSLSQVLAALASALFWFHPIVWYASLCMRAAAESAADDSVLQSGVRPTDYALNLVSLASQLSAVRSPRISLGVFMMKQSRIETRVRHIIAPDRRRRGATLTQVAAIAVLGVLAIFILANVEPILATGPDVRESLYEQAVFAASKHERDGHITAKKSSASGLAAATTAPSLTGAKEQASKRLLAKMTPSARLMSVLPHRAVEPSLLATIGHDRGAVKQTVPNFSRRPMPSSVLQPVAEKFQGQATITEIEHAQKVRDEADAEPFDATRKAPSVVIAASSWFGNSAFHAIRVTAGAQLTVKVTRGRGYSARSIDNPNWDYSSHVRDGVLDIHGGDPTELEVTAPQIDRLEVAGASSVVFSGVPERSFEVNVSGESSVRVTGAARTFTINVSGASSLHCDAGHSGTLKVVADGQSSLKYEGQFGDSQVHVEGASSVAATGRTGKLVLDGDAASSVDLSGMPTQDAVVRAKGASKLTVNVGRGLVAKAEGASEIKYSGQAAHIVSTPDISSTISR